MRSEDKMAALVLAAGYSSRAQGFKPLLPLGESTVIENTLNSFCRAGISDITVVVGHRADELAPVLDGLKVRHVFNERYAEGMFSSVITGVQALRPDAEAFFLLPADIPLVRSHTVRLLVRAFRETGADVVYPVFQGERGHPPLISVSLLPAILAWNKPGGLRSLLAHYEPKTYEVDVLDEGVLLDLDTPADYQEIAGRIYRRHIPTSKECDAIVARQAASDIVIRHGRLVAEVARQLADRLNQAGLKLDVGLVTAAGLLHDLAKGRPSHARHGAKIIKSLGYPQVAALVACHNDIAIAEDGALDEAAVVYLADKLVKKDRIVSVDERFRASREKYAADADALAAVARRLATAQSIVRQIEAKLGGRLAKIIPAAATIRQVFPEG
jgi:CTP:molybdopterin cytidylyltransferase MocA